MCINKSTLLNIANNYYEGAYLPFCIPLRYKTKSGVVYLPYNGINFLQVALIIYVSAKLYFSASLKSMPGTSYAEISSTETEL